MADVLGALRTSLAEVLRSVEGVRKPADLHKLLKLDWTLSWQLFQVANLAGDDVPVRTAGSNVPSRTSLTRFLDGALSRGVAASLVGRVWADYERFEQLVDVHAGDRTTFNSMVAGVAGLDEGGAAAELQHRRNAFRAMRHMLGLQARTKHICAIHRDRGDGWKWDFATVSGLVDLRTIRDLPRVLVFRSRITDPTVRHQGWRQPLGDEPAGGGFLISAFSTKPLPDLECRELDAGWIVDELVHPVIGNGGKSTLRFGTLYHNPPAPPGPSEEAFEGDVAMDIPVEVAISDALVQPGLMEHAQPEAEVFLGNSHSDRPELPGERVTLPGNHRLVCLGQGPEALASQDVPDYPELIRATAARLGWDIEHHEAWRLRVEFPVYQATMRMKWRLPWTAGDPR